MDRASSSPTTSSSAWSRSSSPRTATLEDGFVLDGFPRTAARPRSSSGCSTAEPLDVVVDLDVPTEIVLDRIAGRRVCEDCGADVPRRTCRRSPNWTCDECGGKVVQRDDDTEEAVRRRLELYEQETVPLIDFYRRVGKLVAVDGVGEGDEVFERLVEIRRIDRSSARAVDDHPQDPGADRPHAAGRARSSPRCTRSASGRPSPGATTADVDKVAREVIERRGARSNFLGYGTGLPRRWSARRPTT